MHKSLAIVALLVLSGCTSLSEKQTNFFGASHTSLAAENMPGLGDMWAETKQEKADRQWWDSYYGHKTPE